MYVNISILIFIYKCRSSNLKKKDFFFKVFSVDVYSKSKPLNHIMFMFIFTLLIKFEILTVRSLDICKKIG